MSNDSSAVFNDGKNHFTGGCSFGEQEAATLARLHGVWFRIGPGRTLHVPTEEDGRVEPICGQVSVEDVREKDFSAVPRWMIEDNVCGACINWMDREKVRGEIAEAEFMQRV